MSNVSHDPYRGASRAVTAEEQEAAQENAVPSGTSKEIMSWVGEDADRAQAALDAENENDSPRKGLVADLEKMLKNE